MFVVFVVESLSTNILPTNEAIIDSLLPAVQYPLTAQNHECLTPGNTRYMIFYCSTIVHYGEAENKTWGPQQDVVIKAIQCFTKTV